MNQEHKHTGVIDQKNTLPKVALMSYAMDNRSAKGIALYTRRLITGLFRDNTTHPEFDFSLVHYEHVSDPLYVVGEHVHDIIMPRVRLPFGSHFISQMLFFWKYRNDPFDIVHWFHPRVYPFFWLVPAKKIVVTMHGAGDKSGHNAFVFSRSVFNFVLTHFHRYIDAVIVVSENARDEVTKHYGIPKEKIYVTYNGGAEEYMPLQQSVARKIAEEKYGIIGKYILDVSRLLPHKNVTRLVQAYALMRRQHPERTEKLVVVGGLMNAQKVEYAAANQSGFREDIVFVDYVASEDLNALYAGAEVFAFPSLSEGFGLPVLEAMASGTPVVTSNTTSLPEVGGDAVVTVDPFDVQALADAIYRVLSDQMLYGQMITAGLTRAKEFTWQKMVDKTIDIYQKQIHT